MNAQPIAFAFAHNLNFGAYTAAIHSAERVREAAFANVPKLLSAWFAMRPAEAELETGRLVATVAGAKANGWTKRGLVNAFYPEYSNLSAQAQISAEMKLDKLLQRARRRLQGTGLEMRFCGARRRWVVYAIGM